MPRKKKADTDHVPTPPVVEVSGVRAGYGYAEREGIKCVVDGFHPVVSKKGEAYYIFNAYFQIGRPSEALVISGWRFKDGRILPPYKFNMRSYKFFDTTFCTEGFALLLNAALRTKFDAEIWKIEEPIASSRNLRYDDNKFFKMFPNTALKNSQAAFEELRAQNPPPAPPEEG